MDVAKRIEELRRRLEELSYAYYVLDQPRASDAEYDELFRELERLEAEHPEFDSPYSPTKKVGAPPASGFREVRHLEPMLSLANALTDEDIVDFDRRIKKDLGLDGDVVEYVMEPKVDGIGISLTYEDGLLTLGATRGDGYRGEDITDNVKTIRSIPLRLRTEEIAPPRLIEIRGEAYTEKSLFEEFNAKRTEEEGRYANPRNFTGGSLRQLDSKITASRPLDALFYATGRIEGADISSQRDLLVHFRAWGLKTADPWILFTHDIQEAVRHHARLEEERDRVPYEIDGTVLKVNDFRLRRTLGIRTRSPRWAIACKFKPRQTSTRLLDVEVSVGRTGALTPVAVLDPVRIGGVTVSSASLHNWDEIKRLDVRIGDRVLVERAGDVIPKVVKALTGERNGRERPIPVPTHCPVCGTAVEKDENEVVVRCPNRHCPAQLEGAILHFVSKDAMDIEGMGEKLVHQLVETGKVKTIADLYALSKEDLLSLERMGDLSATNVLTALESSKTTTLPRLIYALGIRHVGPHVAELVAGRIQGIKDLYEMGVDELAAIHGIGEKAAHSIVGYFGSQEHREVIDALLAAGVKAQTTAPKGDGPLAGKTFVLTGTLEGMTRKEAENLIKRAGGKPVSSVSRATDYLVVGEKPGSKLKKAKALGVTIIDEKDLLELAGGPDQ
ncbi:MAG TPA: NAD-dependent DNA ligase LigA [Planctomycetes bacterium]|nr:NAD-dependent DNA ligase LigA [Planctomycetota bacterium]